MKLININQIKEESKNKTQACKKVRACLLKKNYKKALCIVTCLENTLSIKNSKSNQPKKILKVIRVLNKK